MSLRIALCIGVADYHEKALKLTNSINDADCIHKALQSRGFDSTLLLDPTADVLMQALTDLSGKIAENGGNRAFGVVFFAGHAIEIGGFGILMPTDMAFPASPQAIRRSGIPVLEIIKALSAVHGPKVVIIDACRDADPVAKWDQYQVPAFNEWMDEEMGRMRDATDVNEVAIAYSTSAGQKAYEGAGLNSLYCEKLQASLLHHGSTIVEALTQAGSHVTAETLAKQRPWVYTNMGMKCGFGDLPTYALAYTTTLTGELHSGSRLHVRMEDDSLAVNLTGKLQFLQDGTATGGIIHSPKVSVACFWKDEVLLAGANCFVSVDSTMKDKRRPLSGFEEIATEFEKPHGIAIGPDGMSAIVYGSGGYSVLRRADAKWKLHYSGNQPSDIYGAIFQSTDVAYLCGSGNYILRLNLGGEKPQLSKIEIESYLHIYDMTWLSDQRSIVAVCSQGVVIWINVDSLESNVRQMFIWPSIDVPGAYGRLRRMDLSPEEASLFLEDRKTFDVKVGRKAWSRLSRKACPDYDLLCCTLTSDPRVLAIGSDAGLVFLIDVRSGEPFATLDAGSGIGARLQWMACPANGSINVLAGDGIVRCFEPVLPQA